MTHVGREHLAGSPEQPVPARDQERADEHRVDQDADHECEAKLAQRAQWTQHERREAARRDDRGRADQTAGLADGPNDAVRAALVFCDSSLSLVIRKTL